MSGVVGTGCTAPSGKEVGWNRVSFPATASSGLAKGKDYVSLPFTPLESIHLTLTFHRAWAGPGAWECVGGGGYNVLHRSVFHLKCN